MARKRPPRRERRFGNWKKACYEFLLEQDEPINACDLTIRVVTKSGRPWENGPSTREITQVLKYDDRFVYVGDVMVSNLLGSTHKRAAFVARRVEKDE